ncbi:MAG: hypothetical protein ABFC75_03125 [Rectinema sp.]
MPNRFAKRIRNGEIPSVESLKAEFKSLAKVSHPDLAGQDSAEEFILVRDEYEQALRDFDRHRWGFRRVNGESRSAEDAGRNIRKEGAVRKNAFAYASFAPVFAALALLLKRGFPKEPRHERQKLRYEYARWRFASTFTAAVENGEALLDAFERDYASLIAGDTVQASSVSEMLDELIEYSRTGVPAMRTSLILALGSIRADRRFSPDMVRFLEAAAGLAGIGPALG